MKLIQRFGIAHRVFVLGFLALAGVTVMAILSFGQMRADRAFRAEEAQFQDLRRSVDMIDSQIQRAAIAAERFLGQPSPEAASPFREAVAAASDSLISLGQALAIRRLTGNDELSQKISAYGESFETLFAANEQLGFSAVTGLRGAMQTAVDKVEKLTLDVENAELRASMLTLRKHEKDFMLWRQPATLDAFQAELPNFKAHLKKTYPPGPQRMKVAQALDMYVIAFRLFSEGSLKEAEARQALAAGGHDVEAGLEALVLAIGDALASAQAESEAVRAANQQLAVVAVAGVTALILCTVWLVGRSISRPVKAITLAMRRLAEGDTAQSVAHLDQPNEIGAMVRAIEVFRQSAIERLHLEQEAENARAEAAEERVRLQQEAEAHARERLEQATAGLAEGLRRLAAGDLTVQLEEAFSAEFEGVRSDLNRTVAGLRELMGGIDSVSQAIDAGSRAINAEAMERAERSMNQVAALEETAAALDQIAHNVQHSAQMSHEARNAVRTVNASMEKTGSLVEDAVEAMARIEHSSRSIGSIIGVIDEIAFQTNLLALNAGVEAARAGEAGKGFAVVAHEVRELAQRSANAAKEIKALIDQSGKEVAGGARFVRETGAALGDIGREVRSIQQHMESIASAASEQSAGIVSVNDAVTSMDKVAQQNSALVERNQVAVAGLEDQASRLRELLGRFRLAGAGSASGHDLRSHYGRAA